MGPVKKKQDVKRENHGGAKKPEPGNKFILEGILKIAESIQDEEADKLPRNLAENLDDYLYGSDF